MSQQQQGGGAGAAIEPQIGQFVNYGQMRNNQLTPREACITGLTLGDKHTVQLSLITNSMQPEIVTARFSNELAEGCWSPRTQTR